MLNGDYSYAIPLYKVLHGENVKSFVERLFDRIGAEQNGV
jgi:hypothetical protein